MLKKMTLKESIAHNKGTQLRGRQILWLICKEFEVNASLGFTYGIDDLTMLAFPGDSNLQQFLNRWDEIVGFLDMTLIPETTISQMFLKKIVGSKTLASEVSHWRRLKDTDPDRTYQWLRDSVEKVIQIEREDKNQEDLQEPTDNQSAGSRTQLPRQTTLLQHRETPKEERKRKRKRKEWRQVAQVPWIVIGFVLWQQHGLHHSQWQHGAQETKCLANSCSCTTTARKETSVTSRTGPQPQQRSPCTNW